MTRQGRIFYGWWIVAVCFLSLFVFAGTGFYIFGIFLKPLMAAFDWSRTTVSLAFTLYFVTMGLAGPLVGRITDRYGAKRIIIAGGFITGIGFCLLSFTTSLWYFYLIYAIISIGLAAHGIIPATALVGNWFTRKRGRASGIAIAGIGVGAIAFAPTAGFLINSLDWNRAYIVIGVAAWLLIVPAAALVLRERPQDMGLLPDGDNPGEVEASAQPLPSPARDWTLAEAWRTSAFWLLTIAFLGTIMGVVGTLQHQAALLTDLNPSLAAGGGIAVGFTGCMGALGKLFFGNLTDRIPSRSAAIICFALQVVGIIILLQAKSMALMWVFMVVFGFSMGGNIALLPLVVGNFFGLASFGAILGVIMMVVSFGSSGGPLLAGFIYDTFQSYHWAFVTFLGMYLLALTAIILVRRPTPPLPASSYSHSTGTMSTGGGSP